MQIHKPVWLIWERSASLSYISIKGMQQSVILPSPAWHVREKNKTNRAEKNPKKHPIIIELCHIWNESSSDPDLSQPNNHLFHSPKNHTHTHTFTLFPLEDTFHESLVRDLPTQNVLKFVLLFCIKSIKSIKIRSGWNVFLFVYLTGTMPSFSVAPRLIIVLAIYLFDIYYIQGPWAAGNISAKTIKTLKYQIMEKLHTIYTKSSVTSTTKTFQNIEMLQQKPPKVYKMNEFLCDWGMMELILAMISCSV